MGEKDRLTYVEHEDTEDDIGISHADRHLALVIGRIEKALERVTPWIDAGDPLALPPGSAEDIAYAYGTLRNLERWLPLVTGYAVGYFWGRDYKPEMTDEDAEAASASWSCFSAHTSEGEAQAFAVAWRKKQEDGPMRRYDVWRVRFMPTPITKFMKPGTNAKKYVGESAAFTT